LEEINGTFEIQTRLGFKITSRIAEVWGGLIHLTLGDMERAEKYFEAAAAGKHQKITNIVELNLGLGKLRLEQDRVEEAQACFEKCVEAFKGAEFTTDPLLHIEALLLLTSIYARQGRLDEAKKMSEWATRLAETLKSDVGLAMARQAKETLLLAGGDRKGAEEAYLECVGLWQKAGWPYYQAKALVAYSEAVVKTNPEESKKRLQQAVEVFKRLGAKRDLEKAQTKLSG
jgi:tetratricopeptide (TPR) repeat protein